MSTSTALVLGVLALSFTAGCAAAPASDDGQTNDGAMTSFSAERSSISTGHYASDDGKTMLFVTDNGNTQHASLSFGSESVEVDVNVGTLLGGNDLEYIEGVTHCDDALHYVNARGITIAGNCTDSTDLFIDNQSMTGAHKSAAGISINVTSANAWTISVDVGSAKDVSAKWISGAEARGTAESCGTIAVVFADTTHAEAYWVDGQPTNSTCPTLPSYPSK